MNAAELLRHYHRVADASDAVPQLRDLIIELAMIGNLVPQDRGDEDQLDALAGARKQLAELAQTTGRLRFSPSPPISDEELSSAPPPGWIAARVNDTGLYINGLAFKPANWKPTGLPIIRIQNLTDESREFNYAEGDFPDEVLVRAGDILVSWSATLDAFRWSRQTGVLNQHIFRVIPAQGLTSAPFLLLLLKRAIREMADSDHAHGLVMTHINRGPFLNHVVLIPPLAEQHRIVAKVDELMTLCDRLEAARAKRETARDRLTAATLAPLNSPDAETFAGDAGFVLDNLPVLSARQDQMRALRQTFLNLAMLGRLSRQREDDEPALDLLARTSKDIDDYREKHGLGGISFDAPAESEKPFVLPTSWQWVRLAQLCRVITDGDHQPPPKADSGVAFLTIGNVTTGHLDFTDCRFVPRNYFESLARYRVPAKGDILYTVVGATFGRPAFVETDREFCVQRHIAILKPSVAIDARFLVWLLGSRLVYEQARACTTGTAQPTIPLRPLRNLLVPLPPFDEQARIVAIVDRLMALCDQLEQGLVEADRRRSQLLGALLHQALEPSPSLLDELLHKAAKPADAEATA